MRAGRGDIRTVINKFCQQTRIRLHISIVIQKQLHFFQTFPAAFVFLEDTNIPCLLWSHWESIDKVNRKTIGSHLSKNFKLFSNFLSSYTFSHCEIFSQITVTTNKNIPVLCKLVTSMNAKCSEETIRGLFKLNEM